MQVGTEDIEMPSGVSKTKAREVTFTLCPWCVSVRRFVSLMGSLNGRNPATHQLARHPDGGWRITLSLPPGEYRYLFIVDGRPVNNPDADDRTEYPCEWGTGISVRTVA